jgi:phage N-6-adenine-methyltransferase
MGIIDQIRAQQNGHVPSVVASYSGGLARYDAACRAVAEAKSVDEVKSVRDQAEAMRAYAKQAKNKQLEIDASEIRFRAERRIGELMGAQRETVGLNSGKLLRGSEPDPRASLPTLSEAGIDKHLADRARKYAAVPEQEFESILADRRDRIETENKRVTVNLMEAGHRVTLNTGENEWYTPDEYLDLARQALGGFDLDPASSRLANERVRATNIFTEEDDGLKQEWKGRVWMNPPYAQPLINDFADKLVAEYDAGNVTAAIVLTNDSTDTAWFHTLANNCSGICFTRGRIRFVSPRGEAGTPTQGQAFFYFGIDADIFADVFHDVGFVAEVRK